MTPAAGIRSRPIAILLAMVLLLGIPRPARAALPPNGGVPLIYGSGLIGQDVSFPQCNEVIPSFTSDGKRYAFAVLGTNGGVAFTVNRCFVDEYEHEMSRDARVSFYVDVNAPVGPTANFAMFGPGGTCETDDRLCVSYNYGYGTARAAFEYAGTRVGWDVVTNTAWWLDVEIGKPWSADPRLNAQVIQGAIDFFQQHDTFVGVYSIPSMWQRITGSDYHPGVPVWISGARSLDLAPAMCVAVSFSGGPVWLVQQPGKTLDQDYAC